jgi:hypothetical protein
VFKHVLKSLKEVRLQMWFDSENKSFNAEFTLKLATHNVTSSKYIASQHHQKFPTDISHTEINQLDCVQL